MPLLNIGRNLHMNWNDLSTQVVAALVAAAILGAGAWLWPRRVSLGLRLKETPWAISFVTAIVTAALVSAAIGSIFARRIGASPQTSDEIGAVKTRLGILQMSLQSWGTYPPGVGNEAGSGDLKSPTMCPQGYYAVGINWWGAPSSTHECIGCLSGIQVVCSKLNVQ